MATGNGGASDSTVTRKLDEVTNAVTSFAATTAAELKALQEKVDDLEAIMYKGGADGEGVTAQLKFIQKDIEARNKRATEYVHGVDQKLLEVKDEFTKALAISNNQHIDAIEHIKKARAKERADADQKWNEHRRGFIRVFYGAIGAAVIGLAAAFWNVFIS